MILVTGGTGFLGSHLIKKLVCGKYNVRVLIKNENDINNIGCQRLDFIVGDIRNEDVIKRALKGIETVIHLAVGHQSKISKKKDIWDINVKSTINLLNESTKNKVTHFIYCSSARVTCNKDREKVDENSPYVFNKDDIYEKSKAFTEEYILKFSKENKLPITIIRPSLIYGEGDQRLLRIINLIQRRMFFFIGSGNNIIQLVYVGDVVAFIMRILENEKSRGEIFLIAGEERITLKEYICSIAKELNTTLPNLTLPYYPFLILSFLCEKFCNFLNIVPPLFPSRIRFFVENNIYDISKARTILNFSPTVDIRTGMKKTIQWFRENRLIQ